MHILEWLEEDRPKNKLVDIRVESQNLPVGVDDKILLNEIDICEGVLRGYFNLAKKDYGLKPIDNLDDTQNQFLQFTPNTTLVKTNSFTHPYLATIVKTNDQFKIIFEWFVSC